MPEYQIDHTTELLSLARYRAAHIRPYYASALLRLIPVKTDQVDTLAVDPWWRLYYNQGYLERLHKEEKDGVLAMATALVHEVEHLLRDHAGRCSKSDRDHEIFNIAGDLEINDGLKSDKHLCVPDHWLVPKRFKLPDDKLAEWYYGVLDKNVKRIKASCGSGAHGKREKHDLPDPGKAGSPRGLSPEDASLTRSQTAREIQDHAAKHPGTVPGSLLRWANDVLTPKIPWQSEFKAVINAVTAGKLGMADYSLSRMNRRSHAYEPFIFPAMVDPILRIGVVIDTSGSMQPDQLSAALAEVKGILKSCAGEDGIHVYSADACIQSAQKVFSARSIQLKGGGGTDMAEAIEMIDSSREKFDYVVVITDGLTPWPPSAPRTFKTIVVLVGEPHGVEAPPAWARVIRVPSDDQPRTPKARLRLVA